MILKKVKWILGILLVFFLVLATNLIDRNNFNTVQESLEIIYDTQLLNKNILLDLSTLVHEKAMANALHDTTFYQNRNREVNEQIDKLFHEFEETELVYKERLTLDLAKEKIDQINVIEEGLFSGDIAEVGPKQEEIARELEKVSGDLVRLSLIQLEEGRRQMKRGENALSSIDMFTKLEVFFLIFIAVLVQILILFNPKTKEEKEQS